MSFAETVVFDRVDDTLTDWVHDVLDRVEVSLERPGGAAGGGGVSVWLAGFRPAPELRSPDHASLDVVLRYWVTTWAESPRDAHRMLGELTVAAMEDARWTVAGGPAPEEWRAIGVEAGPVLVLEVPARHVPEPEVVPVAGEGLRVDASSLRRIRGRVLGPRDIPIALARVEALGLGRRTKTDMNGWFALDGLPAGVDPLRLKVKARGHEIEVTRSADRPDGDALVVHMEGLES